MKSHEDLEPKLFWNDMIEILEQGKQLERTQDATFEFVIEHIETSSNLISCQAASK
jgi:hypothetical protein